MLETKRNSLQGFCAAHLVAALCHLLPLLLLLPFRTKATASANIALPGCPGSCGKVLVPYPFGIGPNCSLSSAFELICDATNIGTFAPRQDDYTYLNISLSLGQALVDMPISSQCYNTTTKRDDYNNWEADLRYFRFNHEKNKFVVIGCDTLGYVSFTNSNKSYLGGCVSGCSGIGCGIVDLSIDRTHFIGLSICRLFIPAC